MDIYDGAEWTEMDIEDLKAAIEHGRSIEEAAEFLCRADRVDDVARVRGTRIEAEAYDDWGVNPQIQRRRRTSALAHYGLKSDLAPGPKSAKRRHRE
jgi:hypothetical protein